MKPSSEKTKSASKVSSRGSLEGRVPSLRFPGFEGEWETARIGELYSERSQRCTKPMELLSVTISDGVVPRSNIESKDNSSEDKSNYKVVHVGDMVYNTMRMWQGACGVSSFRGIVSPAYTILKEVMRFDRKFMASLFKTKRLINDFRKNSQGLTSDTWNLKYPQIAIIKVSLPDIEEQQQIATFLSLLDSRIAAQRKLVELLKKQKRGLLKEIFERSAEGEYKSFYDIVVRRSEKVTPTKDSGLDCIELEHIEPETGLLLGSVQLREQDSLKNLCKPNDIVFGRLRPYLRKFLFAKTECAVSSETWVLTAADGILPKFLFYLIQSEPFMQAANVSSGTKMPRSEWSNVANAKFHIPNAGRQLAIANCLSEVDTRIHQTQRVISAMEVYKRGLLQALFV